MAADNTGAKSSSAADSYVGSLISLTSKSEIRYEGILYNINTDESSIGLQNVRSFGTEGRKKDGPQVPPSDKVYEYILFRGTDIKDLQVKASPPVQPPPPTINNDPAIIQSHYPSPMPTSGSLPSTASGSLPDISSHNGQPGMGFQNAMPLYQPGGNLGSWGASPQPPMYWQGFYTPPPNGLPQLHQQSLIRPPHGLPMPNSLQQPMQYPNFNTPPPTGSSNLQGSSLPEAPSSLFPFSTSSQILAPSSLPFPGLPPVTLSSSLQSTLQSAPSPSLASEMAPPLLSNKAPITAPPTLPQDTNLLPFSLSTTRATEVSAAISLSNKPSVVTGPISLPQTTPLTSAPVAGVSSSISQDKPKPLLVTPGQLLQSGSSAVSLSPPSTNADKDVEVVQVSSSAGLEQSVPVTSEAQPPILPLPSSARPTQKEVGHAAAETFLLTRLCLKLLSYLGVGYRWITRFMALGCYAFLLMPGFIQVGYYYFFSPYVRRSIVYGDQPRNRLDLYLPKNSNGPKPVVASVTGGAWIIGYKAWGSLLGQQLSERDIIVACIDYRNFPQGSISDMVNDTSSGISFVCNHIAEYGGDPDRIYLMGQSAGAHIAACTIVEQVIKESGEGDSVSWSSSQINAYFGLSGGYNLLSLVDHFHSRGLYRSIFLSIMEGEESLRQFSPELVVQNPNLKHIIARLPPFILFHGTDDYSIPSDASKSFAETLQRLGAKAKVILYEGKTHTDLFLQDPMRGGKDEMFEDIVSVVLGDNQELIGKSVDRRRLVPEFMLKLAHWVSPF